jgi:hypothetical protein
MESSERAVATNSPLGKGEAPQARGLSVEAGRLTKRVSPGDAFANLQDNPQAAPRPPSLRRHPL